jgi:hypothetical protein
MFMMPSCPDSTGSPVEAERILGFLAFIDTLERLDTLILEVRHTQVNIIHQLRLPALYRPLRFEEDFLWGTWPAETDDDNGVLPRSDGLYRKLGHRLFDSMKSAEEAIIGYPPLTTTNAENARTEERSSILGPEAKQEVRKEIQRKMRRAIDRLWLKGAWSATQKRQYHLLCVLQDMKRDMLRDKLRLCASAMKTFERPDMPSDASLHAMGRFMLFRAAVQGRLRDFVVYLGDLQGQFARDLDMGLRDQPRPLLERRREQGLYSGFLADFCRHIQGEIASLLGFFGVQKKSEEDIKIMHRWAHDFTSRNQPYLGSELAQRGRSTVAFINTSYWMLERPDLQPIIAHEIAHVLLVDCYDELHSQRLSNATDEFARLLRTLHHCISRFQADPWSAPKGTPDLQAQPSTRSLAGHYLTNKELRPRQLVTEIAADLLATAIIGPGYLLAMFLSGAGAGLEELFRQPNDSIDLTLMEFIDDRGHNALIDASRQWYVRFKVACAWLRRIQHRKKTEMSRLEDYLIQGVERNADDLFAVLAGIDGVDPEADGYWRRLTGRLSELVAESNAAAEARRWRHLRGNDYERHGLLGSKEGRRLLPRSTRRLPIKVREMLCERMLAYKCQPGQPLGGLSGDDARAALDRFYLGRIPENKARMCPLFQHHYDIPWQSSILRALDFFPIDSGSDADAVSGSTDADVKAIEPQRWLVEIHEGTSLGRDMYQIALEFHYWQLGSAFQRLSEVFRFVCEVVGRQAARDDTALASCEGILEWALGDDLPSGEGRYAKCQESCRSWLGEVDAAKACADLTKQVSACSLEVAAALEAHRVRNRAEDKTRAVLRKIAGRFSAVVLLASHPKSPYCRVGPMQDLDEEWPLFSPGQYDRFLEKVQGHKLKLLYTLLTDANGQSWGALFAPLRGFLAMHERKDNAAPAKGGDDESSSYGIDQLVEAFRPSSSAQQGESGGRRRSSGPSAIGVHDLAGLFVGLLSVGGGGGRNPPGSEGRPLSLAE